MYKHAYWSQQLDNLAAEMARLSVICDVKMIRPGVFGRVMDGDETVCGHKNPEVFRKLRLHLTVFFRIEERAIRGLSDDEVGDMLDAVLRILDGEPSH